MKISNKKVLVTGGAGFIGSNLVAQLVERNNTVTVLDDFSTGKHENLLGLLPSPNGVRVVEGSILDYPLVSSLVRDVDVVFHLAVQCLRLSFTNPDLVHDVNATGTLNLLRACEEHRMNEQITKDGTKAKLERFVYVSSSEVYGTAITAPMKESHPLNPTTVYGASKLAGELYTQAYFRSSQMPCVVIRPFNSYGFNEHWEGASGEVIPRMSLRIMNNLSPIIFGNGEQTRDFTFVTETAQGMIAVAECDQLLGQAVNVAYGQEVSIKHIAELLLQKLGRSDLKIDFQPDRPGDVYRHFADTTLLERSTGFKPQIAIDQGLDKFLEWFGKQFDNASDALEHMQDKNWLATDTKDKVLV